MLHKIATGVISVVKYGCITYCTLHFVASPVVCIGSSMEPCIHSGDIVIAFHYPTLMTRTDLEQGDVVIAKSPENPTQFICKRIAGVEGDAVKTRSNWFQTNVVPKYHVWLEGDNKSNSVDSRDYGPVSRNLISSRVVYKVWPLRDVGPVNRFKS